MNTIYQELNMDVEVKLEQNLTGDGGCRFVSVFKGWL